MLMGQNEMSNKILTKTFRQGNRTITRFGTKRKLARKYDRFYGNDNTALIPQIWAQESVSLLYEQMIYAGIVYRDFDKDIRLYGETVNTRIPVSMTAKRKQNDLDSIADNDAKSTNIAVKLNPRAYVSFIIGDGERSKSFKDLFNFYMVPQMQAQAQLLDRVVAGQVYQFLANRSGGLGLASSSTVSDYILDTRQTMNDNKAPDGMRWLGLASPTETAAQKVDLFKSADRVGDGGLALRRALLGQKHGFNTFLSLNTPSIRGATQGSATTTAAAAAAGVTSISSTASITSGIYITIAGDMTPLRVTAVTGAGPYTLTTNRKTLRLVASGAVLSQYASGLINQSSAIAAGDTTAAVANGYPAGWVKEIAVDGTGVPKQGQLVSFKAAGGTLYSAEYCIIWTDGTNILLDRPLEDTVADNDIVDYGPDGDYNFAFNREAIALVNRPLALPESDLGVRAANGFFENMSLRVTMSYDAVKQGTRVTVDGLFGVKVLQVEQGCVFLG